MYFDFISVGVGLELLARRRLTETTYKVDAAQGQALGPDAYAKAGVSEGSEGSGLKVVGTGSETENAAMT